MYHLKNARLIDGTGREPQTGTSLLVDDAGQIEAIGEALNVPPDSDYETLDLQGKTVIPGLIDCHVHITVNPDTNVPKPRISTIPIRDKAYWKSRILIYTLQACRETLHAGFTTIRDLAAYNDLIFPLRDSINAGESEGPRIIASGHCLAHTGGHGTEAGIYEDWAIVADGADALLHATRYQLAAGADVIKIMGGSRAALSPPYRGGPGYSTAEMRVVVEEAHAAGYKVATHAHTSITGIKNTIRAGVDTLEHGYPLDDEAIDLLLEHETILCPTLSVFPRAVQAIEAGNWTYPGSEPYIYRSVDLSAEAFAKAVQAGVKVAMGTDAGMPYVMHGGSGYEIALMVDYGMTPMQALVASTRNAAEALGLLDKIGTLEADKNADLVVVDGDPLEDITILQSPPLLVMKDGEIAVNRLEEIVYS